MLMTPKNVMKVLAMAAGACGVDIMLADPEYWGRPITPKGQAYLDAELAKDKHRVDRAMAWLLRYIERNCK